MFDQMILLIFIILGTAATIFLYVWKAKKQIEYRGDERWQIIQIKAGNIAGLSNYILIFVAAVIDIVIRMNGLSVTLSWNRVFTCVILFVAVRNFMELSALFYYNQKL